MHECSVTWIKFVAYIVLGRNTLDIADNLALRGK